MRTTVDLPDELLRAAKARAAVERNTLSRVISDALQVYLEGPRGEDPPFELLVRGKPGGSYPSPQRVQELLDEQDWTGLD